VLQRNGVARFAAQPVVTLLGGDEQIVHRIAHFEQRDIRLQREAHFGGIAPEQIVYFDGRFAASSKATMFGPFDAKPLSSASR